MSQDRSTAVVTAAFHAGELFSFLLCLRALESGDLAANTGPHVQAAFLDVVRKQSPQLSAELHVPNRRRPYTLSLLDGFYHRAPAEYLNDATAQQRSPHVREGQTFWLRVTLLDARIMRVLFPLLLKSSAPVVRVGAVSFVLDRVIAPHVPDPSATISSFSNWIGTSTFRGLYHAEPARRHYTFEFTTPTAFSKGQRRWGKQFILLPSPGLVFDSLANQWDCFAPSALHLARANVNNRDIETWCNDEMVVSQYALSTAVLHSNRFGQIGFRGQVTFEVKGDPRSPVARWLTMLAHFAFFSGVGYKTAMGMGQTRCLSLTDESQRSLASSGRSDV